MVLTCEYRSSWRFRKKSATLRKFITNSNKNYEKLSSQPLQELQGHEAHGNHFGRHRRTDPTRRGHCSPDSKPPLLPATATSAGGKP